MKIRLCNVYCIVRDPPKVAGKYLSRFLDDVFETKANASASFKDVARDFAREKTRDGGPGVRTEFEFERNEARLAWYREERGQEVCEEIRLRIEKVSVPENRIRFVGGRAKVENWEDVLNKDPRFRDWDAQKWVNAFSVAGTGDEEYSVEELRSCCDWWKFIGLTERDLDVCKFVVGCPWFMDRPECAQINIAPELWPNLLEAHPRFASRCTVWNDFGGSAWASLLVRRPVFSDRCDWNKLSGDNWASLLAERPELAPNCRWERLEGGDWCSLLKRRPEFADKCNWSCLRGRDWCELLAEMPEFEGHLIVERLRDGTAGGCGWLLGFLEKFPQHISDCDLRDLGDWPRFLRSYPQYADQCDFSRFSADGWDKLLPSRPEFIDKVDWSIDWRRQYYGSNVLVDLLEKVPGVYEKCNWQSLRGSVLIDVLAKYPEVSEKCNLGQLSKLDWYNLLLKCHAFGPKCPCWEAFSGVQIGKLLESNIELVEYAGLGEFASGKLTDVLIVAPGLKAVADLGRIDNAVDRMRLCAARPQFREDIQESENWRDAQGFVWKSVSGPIVVVPVSDLIKDFPMYPVDTRKRVENYCVDFYGVRYRGNSYKDHMDWAEARRIVGEIFARQSEIGHRAVAIDGVYVGDEESGVVCNLATIMKQWLEVHETSIRLLYLEYGSKYDHSALEGGALT